MCYSKLLTDDGLAKDGHPKITKAKFEPIAKVSELKLEISLNLNNFHRNVPHIKHPRPKLKQTVSLR